ncbi:MAG: D-tyrosyl-tRNA(Tyr) deacylase [Lentisphaeria bacterium]|nr:D-tyrosyl-tRNA(Tyr) deacylase [Lentisphaeria bacterium]
MRALVQRVTSGQVDVREPGGAVRTAGRIGPGLVVFFGVSVGDELPTAEKLAEKCARLRCFEDEQGKINLDIRQTGGAILVVSQFTLYADTSRGNRPSFSGAARPDLAVPCYERFVSALRQLGIPVETGEFGADMLVSIRNDGPVTLMLEL